MGYSRRLSSHQQKAPEPLSESGAFHWIELRVEKTGGRIVSLTAEQHAGMMSSTTPEWATPQWLFDQVQSHVNRFRFHPFTLDVCATPENSKCERFFTKEQDGLTQSWRGEYAWMNPPYGREIGRWVKKAYEESRYPDTFVWCLLPARTDTAWWHTYCMRSTAIYFIRGRVRFVGETDDNAPFPSCLVHFTAAATRPRVGAFHQHKGQSVLDLEQKYEVVTS